MTSMHEPAKSPNSVGRVAPEFEPLLLSVLLPQAPDTHEIRSAHRIDLFMTISLVNALIPDDGVNHMWAMGSKTLLGQNGWVARGFLGTDVPRAEAPEVSWDRAASAVPWR